MSNDAKKNAGYEFLEHPADVWVHAWGPNEASAFEQCVYALMKTMTVPTTIDIKQTHEFDFTDNNIGSLLVHFLSEFLFLIDTSGMLFRTITIDKCILQSDGLWVLHGIGEGEVLDVNKHPLEKEVKAITYSYLDIDQTPEHIDIKIVYDI
jgi:SHS2 domain-containing protein